MRHHAIVNTRTGLGVLTTLLALASLTLAPGALAGQEAAGSGGADARIRTTLEAAASAGIPQELLESKMKEGRAKGVAEDRIAAALETRLDALVRARDAMREAELETVTTGELSVAADAVQAGVSASVLADVVRSAPEERRLVATAVLASLVEVGVASEQARDRVRAALVAGPAALADLHAEVAAMLRARGGGAILPPLEASGAGRAAAGGLVRIGN